MGTRNTLRKQSQKGYNFRYKARVRDIDPNHGVSRPDSGDKIEEPEKNSSRQLVGKTAHL
jgi:hypothetical protein